MTKDRLPTWAREALRRAEVSPELQPYITARGGVVVLNGPFSLKRAYAAQDHVLCARTDVLRLCEALTEALAALEPLAKVGRSLNSGVGLRVSDDHKALVTAGDARCAAEIMKRLKENARD